jgi:hypothetical protein
MNFKDLNKLQGNLQPDQIARLEQTVMRAVKASLRSHPLNGEMKDREVDRRVDFCVSTALEMHRAGKGTIERICSQMAAALQSKLESRLWVPSDSMFWAVDG